MAGAGYKLFNTGDVLTASDVNTYLQQQVVMVFASAAARTSALSGVLAEGMVTYLQDTNSVQVYNGTAFVAVGGSSPLTTKGDLYTFSTTDARLGVGANGTVLTANSATATGLEFATPAAGGMTLINAGGTTLTGASISLSSIAATFNNLQLIIRNFRPSVDTALIALRFNNDSTASRYLKMQTFASDANAFDPSRIDLVRDTDNGASQSIIVVDIYDYANTTTYKCLQGFSAVNNPTTTTQVNFDQYTGFYNQTGAINEINLISTSGNFTSGTAFLYGVK